MEKNKHEGIPALYFCPALLVPNTFGMFQNKRKKISLWEMVSKMGKYSKHRHLARYFLTASGFTK